MADSLSTQVGGPGKPLKITKQPPAHADHPRPTFVAATPDGRVVTCDDSGGVYLRASAPARATAFKSLRKAKASCIAVSDTGKVLAACYDGVVVISNLADQRGAAVFEDHRVETGADTEVWAVAVSSDGTRALSATNGGEILYWDVGTPGSIARVVGDGDPVAALAFLPDETKFLSGHGEGKMVLWDIIDDGVKLGTVFDHRHPFTVNSIAVFSDNGSVKAITGSFDGRIRIWDLGDGDKFPPSAKPTVLPVKHEHFVWRVAASPNGKKFASAGQDGRVRVFDIAGNLLAEIQEDGGVMGVAFVSDTRLVHTTGTIADPQVRFKDL
jgi:WD40 repeat protein